MRLAINPSKEAQQNLPNRPTSVSYLKGWGNLLVDEGAPTTVCHKALTRCPICQEQNSRLPLGSQGAMVGKASIKEGYQMRSFTIQEPWTVESAALIGEEAKDEWIMEHSTPQLDLWPNKVTENGKAQIRALVSSVPHPPCEFTEHEWDRLAKLQDAAQCYIKEWRSTRNPTLTPAGMSIFKDHVKEDLFEFGYNVSKYGVCSKAHSPPIRSPQSPYPPVRDDPIQTIKDLWSDVIEGRIFLFAISSEDKVGPLMETKLSFVEQKNVGSEGGVRIRYMRSPYKYQLSS